MSLVSLSDSTKEMVDTIKRIREFGPKKYRATIAFDWTERNSCKNCPCFRWVEEFREGHCKVFFDEINQSYGRMLGEYMPKVNEYCPAWCPMSLVEVEKYVDTEDGKDVEYYDDKKEY